uniref:Ion_trans_2 domain-containing protein n=1 Tax=Elaeophora elaphi TaxID=1147741 RepID=A0A0R3S2G7_9BILA
MLFTWHIDYLKKFVRLNGFKLITGYGNITPSTPWAQLFCIAFSVCGIPMTLLTLANLGKYLTKSYWMALVCLGKEMRWRPCENAKMPLPTLIVLFLITFAFGSILFYQKGRGFSVDDIYFSIISFATVGFGDKFPTADNPLRLIAMVGYLVWGMILMTTTFSIVIIKTNSKKLSKIFKFQIHYLGRKLRGARDVHIWFGGKSMKVSKLLEIIANELNASPRQLKGVLRDLDNLISTAAEENQLLSRRSSFLLKGRCSMKKRIGYSLQTIDERKSRYDHLTVGSFETIKEGTLLNQKFIRQRQMIDRHHSIDLGELSRRDVEKFEV